MPLGRLRSGMCADLAKDIVAGLTGNSEWRLDVLDNFGKPVFRVRLLAESLEEAAGFKTVSDLGVRLRLVCSFALAQVQRELAEIVATPTRISLYGDGER